MRRDDTFPYEIYARHDTETGKKVRKKIHFVFWVLLIVTIVEVLIGIYLSGLPQFKTFVKVAFILLTLCKAFYIVGTFMHLADEIPLFRYTILLPYIFLALYLIFILLFEGSNLVTQ